MFSSCSPAGALLAGVKIGSGSCCASRSPGGSAMPQTAPLRLVVLPAGADQVAAHDGLERQGAQLAHDDGPALEQLALIAIQRQLVEAARGQLVRHDMGGAREPEIRDFGQHVALVRNRIGQHDIER
jgi:hypothetical protein